MFTIQVMNINEAIEAVKNLIHGDDDKFVNNHFKSSNLPQKFMNMLFKYEGLYSIYTDENAITEVKENFLHSLNQLETVLSHQKQFLFIGSEPVNRDRLDIANGLDALIQHIQSSSYYGAIKVKRTYTSTLFSIQKILFSFLPHIIHISGHGEKDYIEIINDFNVSTKLNFELLKTFENPCRQNNYCPELIVLDTCLSQDIAKAIFEKYGIKTIGCSLKVRPFEMVSFWKTFYSVYVINQNLQSSFDQSVHVYDNISDQLFLNI